MDNTKNHFNRQNSPGVIISGEDRKQTLKGGNIGQKGKWNKMPRSAFLAERHKRQALYGLNSSAKIFTQTLKLFQRKSDKSFKSQTDDQEVVKKTKSLKERVIIPHDSQYKAIFEVMILLLVGYSCVTSMLYTAFVTPTN